MAYTVVTELGYATAEDGARLDRVVYVPDPTLFPGPRPALILFHAPGFKNGTQINNQERNWLIDAANRGVIGYAPTTRALGTPHIVDQTVEGFYPTQINDAKRAILGAIADARCNGQYIVGGGSGGASLAAYLALDTTTQASPVAWDTTKRPLGGIVLSVASDFSDRTLPEDNIDYFTFVSEGWTNIQDPDSVTQRARSPVAFVTADARPLYIVDGGNREGGDTGNDSMPAAQRLRLVEELDSVGATNYVSIHVPTGGHAFSLYAGQRDPIWAWMDALYAGEPPPPPPPPVTGVTRGVASLTAGGKPVAADARSSANISMISLRVPWWRVQPSPIVFDFSYFTTEIAAALAVNPSMRFNLLVQTGDGSEFLNGFKPNWLFTLLSGTGNHVLSNCTAVSGLSTVTCSATLAPGDVGKRVYVSGMLNDKLVDLVGETAWVGAVLVDPHQFTLSSSPSSNVPITADFSRTDALVEIWTEGVAALDSHVIVPGTTYSFSEDGGAHIVTIPVFWNDILQRRKRLLVTMMGKWWNALPPDQRNAINLVRMSFFNANGDDWHIPEDDTTIDIPGETLTQAQRWLHLPGDVAPGAGYTTQKAIDAVVTQTPIDQTFTTGIIQGTNLKARDAGFSVLDVGKVITGTGVGPGNQNTIVNIQPGDDQQGAIAVLQVAGTNGAVTFTIPVRKTGLFDVAIASFPDILEIGHSIAQNAGIIDKPAADLAGDSDIKNFLARSINTIVQAAYLPLILTQKNGISATTIRASKPPPPTGGYGLFKEISDTGAPVGGQALWRVTGDPFFLMNGGNRLDKDLVPPSGSLTDDQILRRSGERIYGYNAYLYEIYEADVLALPAATGYINDLLISLGPPPPPPPDDTPVITSPPTATGTVGVAFEFFVTATNDPVGFNLNPLPGGLSFVTATGRLFGVPIYPGVYSISVTGFNENGTGPVSILTLTIAPPPVPVITSPLLAHAQVGVHFEYQITATENPTSFNFHPQPGGIAFMPATGLAFGVPIYAGTSSIELTATNENGSSDVEILTLIIAPASVPLPPPPLPLILGIPKIPVCRVGTHARNIILAHKGAIPPPPEVKRPGPVEQLFVETPGIPDSGEATATWISPAGSDPNNLTYKMVLTGGPGTIVIVSQIEI